MAWNAAQLHDAARRWHIKYNYGYDDGDGDVFATGPYRVLVLAGATPLEPFAVAAAREAFPGVPIAYLNPLDARVVTGQLSMHVVPQQVYAVAGWQAHDATGIQAALEPAPFAAPPTEADLAQVFIAAMSRFAPAARGRHDLKQAFQDVCGALGWRTVAALVNGMDEDTRRSSDTVIAVLAALASAPVVAATRAQP